tara:strand:- start:122 stop:904 length:783 start_codon:yes stop_codon:yes gene_type:complete
MEQDLDNLINEMKELDWEILNYNNAIDVSKKHFLNEMLKLLTFLKDTHVDLKRHVITGGGGKSEMVQDLEKEFKENGWKKNNISVKNNISFLNSIPDKVTESSSHEVDHLIVNDENILSILEIEWNNKSEFFDRDIHNIQSSWNIGATELGIIITRSKKLNESMTEDIYQFFVENEINDYPDFEKIKNNPEVIRFSFPSQSHRRKIDRRGDRDFTKVAAEVFWTSKYKDTTFTEQLIKRVERGQLGRAPLIVFGLPPVKK